MRKLRSTASLDVYILDLVYLSGRLSANDETRHLAPPVNELLNQLDEIDLRLRLAQREQVVSQARRDHLDDQLDITLKSSGKIAEGTFGSQQSPEFRRIFPLAPSAIASLTWEEELSRVDMVAGQLEQSTNATLAALAGPLRQTASDLRQALDAYKATFTPLAGARADRDYRKSETNVVRDRVYGQLIATFPGQRSRVEKFFRDEDTTRSPSSSEVDVSADENEAA